MLRWMNEMPALLRQFTAHWKTYLALHLGVALLIFLVLAPLATILLRLAVMLSGDAALSDQDIAWFILSPAGFVAFVVLVSVFSIIVFLEHSAMVTAAWLLERGHPAPVSGVLFFLARRFGRLFGLAVQILFRVLLWTLPFLLALGAVYFVLLTEYDINYYLFNKPSELTLALVLGGLIGAAWLVLLLRLFSSWVFSIPLLLLSAQTPRAVLEQSAQAANGRRLDILRAFFAWLLVMAGIGLAASALAGLAGFLLVRPDAQSIEALLLGLGLASVFGALESLAVSLVGSTLMSLLILKLFHAHVVGAAELPGIAADEVRPAGRVAGRRAAVVGFVALAVVAVGVAHALLNQLRVEGETAVMAHRGASAAAPENTLAAVRGAIESGADWVEIDVQETADGEIVVVHDSDLKKIGGSPLVIGDSRLADLRAVDIGSWFGPEFSDQRIPTLREVLELCRDRIGVNIELKYYGTERRLEEGVAEIVDELGMADQVIVMSLSLPGIQKMAEVRPAWKTGLLSTVAVGNLAALEVDFLALNGRAANRRMVRQLHKQGKQVFVWTVNDPLSMAVMASRGVDGIITDEPAMAVELLARRGELEPSERMLLILADLFDRPSLLQEQ